MDVAGPLPCPTPPHVHRLRSVAVDKTGAWVEIWKSLPWSCSWRGIRTRCPFSTWGWDPCGMSVEMSTMLTNRICSFGRLCCSRSFVA
jgi:hypothetical protein